MLLRFSQKLVFSAYELCKEIENVFFFFFNSYWHSKDLATVSISTLVSICDFRKSLSTPVLHEECNANPNSRQNIVPSGPKSELC